MNRPVDVTFRSEVEHCARRMLLQQRIERSSVANIDLRKDMPWVVPQRLKRLEITGICELVYI
ncbi:hypothetical protein BSU04_14575 [Caballeronia sordidicola]|uniref:Uncharacterized protein n=1 Tax=Caballeronia sordidicola TaxID=196367 RepID=A0A226X4Y7_CABSO|nr:hypothetical protein BSU04_14575 [Caballeronia sordidicola]